MSKVDRQKAWAARVAAYRASGQSASAWCAAHDLQPHQLWYWLRKEGGAQTPTRVTPSPWLSLDLSDQEPSPQTLTIRVGQAAVEVKPGFNPQLLLDVVKTLSTRC